MKQANRITAKVSTSLNLSTLLGKIIQRPTCLISLAVQLKLSGNISTYDVGANKGVSLRQFMCKSLTWLKALDQTRLQEEGSASKGSEASNERRLQL